MDDFKRVTTELEAVVNKPELMVCKDLKTFADDWNSSRRAILTKKVNGIIKTSQGVVIQFSFFFLFSFSLSRLGFIYRVVTCTKVAPQLDSPLRARHCQRTRQEGQSRVY